MIITDLNAIAASQIAKQCVRNSAAVQKTVYRVMSIDTSIPSATFDNLSEALEHSKGLRVHRIDVIVVDINLETLIKAMNGDQNLGELSGVIHPPPVTRNRTTGA